MLMRQKVFSIHALLIGLLLMIGTTAYAEEGSVTLNSGTTSSGPISTASLFVAGDNLYVSATRATISASSNIKIKKLVINRGTLWTDVFSADGLSVSPGTMSFSGTVLTVTDINSSTVQLSRLAGKNVSFSSIVVYYDYTAVTGVTLSQTEASMIVGGETLTLTPTFTPSDASIKTVTWTTSDASVATVANGTVTAVGAGTATITATATNGTDDTSDDKTATCTVTVSYVNVSGVTLSQTEAAMTVGGDALTLTATVAPSNASNKTVTWTTSDASVATVADGVVTAVGAGTATITATATNGTAETSDDQTATCTVTVTEPAAAIFAIDTDGTTQDFGSVEADATAQKTFTVTNNGNATLNVSFAATGDFTVTDPASSRKFYLTDNFGWGTGYAYAWDSKGKALLGEWPGTACGNTINDYGETMFVVTVPSNAAGVIVNNGNGKQTVDITNFTQGYWMDGTLDGSGHYTVEGYEGGSEETPAVLTVAAGESETFTVAMNTATLGSKSGNITLSFDAKNATSFTIPCTGETVSNPTVTANPGGDGNYWSTYYNATKSFTADENTTVYKAALNGTSSVTLTEVTGREIPAGQAVILKSSAASITLTPVASTTADLSDNVLKGGTTITDGYDAYTLSRGGEGSGTLGFYKFSGSLDGSKAHLEILSSAGSRSFIGFGDDNTTGIELPALADDEAGEWYSLDGRRLGGKPARKGVYVKNGQKYIIK